VRLALEPAAGLAIDAQASAPVLVKRDSVLNGVLIGAGVGALLGLIPDHFDDCEECHDSLYWSIAVGAGVGLVVDLLRNPKPAGPPPGGDGLRIGLAVGPRTAGVGGRIRWR
jgi:hypothetical protein